MKRKHPKHTSVKSRHPRLVERGDGLTFTFTGKRYHMLGDLYVRLLAASWGNMIVIMIILYLALNMLFAFGYLATGDGILNARRGSFPDAFFFSVQTFATIGYGVMSPNGLVANIFVTIESMFGFAFYGVVTGLVYSKFSRPTARLMFSRQAIISPFNGTPHFMLRIANERTNRIVDASAKLTLMKDEVTNEGKSMRRFYDLPLVRSESPILRLTWTIMHAITADSPLYKMTHEQLLECEAEIIVSVSGMDETLSQIVHARHSYIADEIVPNASFVDILHRRNNEVLEVRLDRFHDIELNS